MISTYVDYQLITRDIAKSLSRVEAQPMVQRETEYYLENIEKVKSIKEFVGNDRLFRYAMKAHGLEDMAYAKAFMVKALEGGVDEPDSFVNKLSDKRYKEFAKTFDFVGYGETATLFERTRQGTVDKYLRQTLEQDAGKTNEGVRLALYFDRNAANIKNAYDILADPALTKVVYTALGMPASFSAANIDKQAALIEDRLDIAELKDADFQADFLKRFTSLWEVQNPSSPLAGSISVLFSQPVASGISTDLMLQMQKMKF